MLSRRGRLYALIVTAVFLPAGLIVFSADPFKKLAIDPVQNGSANKPQTIRVTLEAFDKIRESTMTLKEVQALLGGPGEEAGYASYPFSHFHNGVSFKGTWRVWRTPGNKDRWIGVKFGHYLRNNDGSSWPPEPIVLETVKEGF